MRWRITPLKNKKRLMEIDGKIHCFFEQSGTFRDAFRKLGYEAEDYDIENSFGRTDHVVDLFREIEGGYAGRPSVFDNISGRHDLIMAFFPCTYFSAVQIPFFMLKSRAFKGDKQKEVEYVIERVKKRAEFHILLLKLYGVCLKRGIRLIVENPYNTIPSYLAFPGNFPTPSIVDRNRSIRGDKFCKPTGYWFFNCEPVKGLLTREKAAEIRNIEKTYGGGGKSQMMARSEISPAYARNFICDFILGKRQEHTEMTLF